MNFADRLAEAVRTKHSALVVGLDPVFPKLPDVLKAGVDPGDREAVAEVVKAYQRHVIEAVAPYAAAVKPQIAFYEQLGPAGLVAYEEAARLAQDAGLLVIGDIKRGDIGSTASAYAAAHLPLADAVTVNPYLGTDSIDPFLKRCDETDGGLFVLVRTSNPSAADLQDRLVDGAPLHERVAQLVHRWGADLVGGCGYSSVGAVAGATAPEHLARLRQLMPRAWFLLPGVGAQGGRAADVAAAFGRDGLGAVVNSSRGILYAYGDTATVDWIDAVVAAARDLRDQLRQVSAQAPA